MNLSCFIDIYFSNCRRFSCWCSSTRVLNTDRAEVPEARMTPPDCCCVAPSPTDHIPTSNHALDRNRHAAHRPCSRLIFAEEYHSSYKVARIINELSRFIKSFTKQIATMSVPSTDTYRDVVHINVTFTCRFDSSKISFRFDRRATRLLSSNYRVSRDWCAIVRMKTRKPNRTNDCHAEAGERGEEDAICEEEGAGEEVARGQWQVAWCCAVRG